MKKKVTVKNKMTDFLKIFYKINKSKIEIQNYLFS
jgi:hypothetical protein